MPSPLPHSADIRSEIDRYLKDAATLLSASTAILKTSGPFRAIYKSTLATDAVLAKLTSTEQPKLSVCRSILRRVPLLIAFGQVSTGRIELRRFIEVAYWCVYFTDHPVEWAHFCTTPETGYVKSTDEPIAFCAHRNLAFYADYAKERFRAERSGLAATAAEELYVDYAALSATVHPGRAATTKVVKPVKEDIDSAALESFGTTKRRICSSSCIMLGALLRPRFDRLPPMHRAWFDWLVGEKRRTVRQGPFGL